ncbi:MAG: MCE family protein [Myxococcales bacterium]|nr:MCE family protein [Myxococcales bacterium]
MSLSAQDERLTRRVGAIALAVIAAAILFFVFLFDRIELGSPVRIKVYFHHSASLREHAALIVGGKRIGQIEAIESVPHGTVKLLGGDVGIRATVAIEESEAWKVRADAEVFVSSRGPLSEKYLEVAPPRHADTDPAPPIAEGAEVLAADPPSLDNVLGHTWTNMTTFRLFVDEVRPEFLAFRGELDKLRTHLAEAAADVDAMSPAITGAKPLATQAQELFAEAQRTFQTGLGGEAGMAQFQTMIAHARTTLAQARGALDQLQPLAARLGGNVDRVRAGLAAHDPQGRLEATLAAARLAIDKIDPLLAKADEISGRLARGEGSLGRLMKDPEFPEDAKELGKILKRQPWKVIAKPKD